jgi:ADP-ribosylglycohydrolase|tara:strand:+ start:13272 stop:14744 length:1473 start_codon:yes stop_codon:yes gene_type:complete
MQYKLFLLSLLFFWGSITVSTAVAQVIEMPADILRDKIRGGLLGQMLGNLNGIPHEMDYIEEPGNVTEYIPALPEGARTDDDTDFEWVYIYVMQQENEIFLSPQRLTQLWKERINRGIWCSNRYARHLMNLGFQPPQTSMFALNPWADFNISGQFICETFGLLAPAMPQTASRIGLNYTRITIDMEPAQTTQLFCTMIATAFITNDIENILAAGTAALDSNSIIRQIINDVQNWHKQYPNKWRTTRRLVKEKYTKYNGGMRDKNGYELNTASTIAALLYGKGDFSKTLMTAFNFGWDADNTAATAGTIIGVIKGHKWMMSQGWKIVDRYKNTKRENMPNDETITSFADRIIDLSEMVIISNGGERIVIDGHPVYKIFQQKPLNVQKLPNLKNQMTNLEKEFGNEVKLHIKNSKIKQELARSAYMAICLNMASSLQENYPERWNVALVALSEYWRVVQNIFFDDEIPGILPLREKALAAGLRKPEAKRDVW